MTESDTSPQPPCHAGRWRAATVICLLVIAIGTATGMSMFEQFKAQLSHVQTKLETVHQIKYVAVLLDEAKAPALLVTLDPLEAALQVQRLNSVTEGREDTMQLWAVPEAGKPRSLGVLTRGNQTLSLPVADGALDDVSRLAISVEEKGGVEPGVGPRLPYLFEGMLIQKAL
jgi:anti-sigma-K factor RskA